MDQERLIEKIQSLIRKDERIEGLWVVGSMATGKYDKYSDIDAYILVNKDDYAQVYNERSRFAEKLGKVVSSCFWNRTFEVIFESCIEVDMSFCTRENVEIFGPYKVLVDKKGDLQDFLSRHVVEFKVDIKKQLGEQLDLAAYNLLHATNMFGRGEYWSSICQIETMRKRFVKLIGLQTLSDVDDEYRQLESFLSKEVSASLDETLCKNDPAEIYKAIKTISVLFVNKARELCMVNSMVFPLERFELLLAHLERIRSERK